MKSPTLYIKFAICYAAVVVLSFSALFLFAKPSIEEKTKIHEAEALYAEATSLVDNFAVPYYKEDLHYSRLKVYLSVYASCFNEDIWVVNTNKIVDVEVSNLPNSEPVAYISTPINEVFKDSYYTVGKFFGYFHEDCLSVCAPVIVNKEKKAHVIIHTPMSIIKDKSRQFFSTVVISLIVVLIIVLIFFSIFLYRIKKPIHKILEVSREFSSGNYKPQIEVNSFSEINEIANTLEFMATKLDTHEDEQRKFIANVSHDLRSPLTSIRGYLQAMIDGVIPEELHEKYLTRVLNESDRLTSLTNNLLDLNRIGARGFTLEISSFDVNSMIINSAESCEVQANAKNVNINLKLTGESMYVTADRGKIEQVIYNLLDNAIKFSKPETTITISTVRKYDKLLVSVSDQGIGIPKESLDNIFNRFYKSDLSRGKDKKGTGLGLSIAKEIIQAHNEKIEAESVVDEGTTFTFSLQLSDSEINSL